MSKITFDMNKMCWEHLGFSRWCRDTTLSKPDPLAADIFHQLAIDMGGELACITGSPSEGYSIMVKIEEETLTMFLLELR